MDRIPIKEAIRNGKIYIFENKNKKDELFRGKIKILNFDEFKLSEKDINNDNLIEFVRNKIGHLCIEYTNLNFNEKDFVTHNFVLSNANCARFNEIEDRDGLDSISIHLDKSSWDVLADRNKTFIPKIKTRIEIFYLLPDEDNNWFLEIKNCEVEEI